MIEKTPAQVGQELLKVVYKASGTKKRHDAILSEAMALRRTTANFTITSFIDLLSRKFKQNEGIIMSYDMFHKLFGAKPTQADIEVMLPIATRADLSVVPLYKKMGDQNIATFIIIHRKLYMAMEISDEMRKIITGNPVTKNPQAWLVGTAIKISEELGQLLEKASTVYKYDIIDALNLLIGDEVYFISHNFLVFNRLDPRDLSEVLVSKGFFVDKIKSDIMRDAEKNELYKDFAELAGINISRTETGIQLGRDNIEILFRCSETVDASLQKVQNKNEQSLRRSPTKH